MSKAGKPGEAAINMGLPALPAASAAAGPARYRRRQDDGRWAMVPVSRPSGLGIPAQRGSHCGRIAALDADVMLSAGPAADLEFSIPPSLLVITQLAAIADSMTGRWRPENRSL